MGTMSSVQVPPGAHPAGGEPPAAGPAPAPAESPPLDAGSAAPRPGRQRSSAREPLRRYPDRGLIGGVCVGIADHLGLDVAPVRIAMALLMAVGGIGVAVYALMWALLPVAPSSVGVPRRPGAWREGVLIVVGVAALLAGLRASGVRFGDSIVWPLVLGACGVALVWRPTVGPGPAEAGKRPSLREYLRHPSQIDAPRVAIGAVLVAFAVASLLHAAGVLGSLGKAIGAVAIVATVLGLLFVPWFVRLARSLAAERAARIREQERAELAAHLHDSVLQTLALIQKRAGDPREVAGLARRQERELRRWLQEGPPNGGRETVAGALQRAAAEVEELHRVPVEVVTVGDAPLEARLEPLVKAAREAMTNAAKFAGSEHVDLYAEVAGDLVEVFVRDRGVGFDPDAIPADRSGVRDSIIGRMERHGGTATVRSSRDAGTEVELVMIRNGA
jgi:signal transduction histidine kinase/phage shock protein PspC (stress-responsive transcriptional regulator)